MTNSLIAEDLTIEGNLSSKQGSVEVKGKVIGDVTAKSLTIQSGGSLDGAASAEVVTIEGKQTGSIKCSDLTLASMSDVRSDIVAQTVTVESGAKVVGKLSVTGKS